MRKMHKSLILFSSIMLLSVLVLSGCEKKRAYRPMATEEQTDDKISYNATDIAVLVGKDTNNGRLSLKSKDTGTVYSVNYNGGTKIKSKYGNDIILEKVDIGDIVEVHYIQGTNKLVELMVSDEAWENTMAVNIDVDYDKKILTIGSSNYAYDNNIFIYSNGKELDIRELSGIDELTVRGYDNTALSIVVNKGHGFVKLVGADNYVDGIIEFGTEVIAKIDKDMIIAVPEGEHNVIVSKNGLGGEQTIVVERGQESVVTFGEFEQPINRVGSVHFIIGPDDADALLYIDNVLTEYEDLVTLSYGKHSLIVTSNNYDTYSKSITIASAYSTININMAGDEDVKDEEEESTKGEDVEDTTNDTTGSNVDTDVEELDDGDESINVNAPEGASVYFDGVYKGVAPVSFAKDAGEHVIIISKDGYETKMYTIDVVSDGEDMDISLPEMLESD